MTAQPEPLKISRVFKAPRELVFRAWSHSGHVTRWFCPTDYTVPEANVHMRVGGPFDVCMQAPDGTRHWTRGTFAEVSPHDRLVLDLYATDATGARLFRAYTEVNFTQVPEGTRMDVVQTYTFEKPELAAPMVKGAPVGWSQTLDKLEAEIARMKTLDTKRSVAHGVFHLKRSYDAQGARVFKAFSDLAAKSKWFGGPEGQMQILERTFDFRTGGRERFKGRWSSGMVSCFDAIYHDIVPNERIVYSYEMHLDDKKISVSLATIQIVAESPTRTTLMVSEQGAFLDGYDDAGSREHGTGFLLDRLGASLMD